LRQAEDADISMPERARKRLDELQSVGSFHLEDEKLSHSVLPLAGFLAQMLLRHDRALVLLESTKVWPSNTDTYLARSFFIVATQKEATLPDDGTSFIFDVTDTQQLRSLFFLAFLFGWELSAWSLSGTSSVRLSNDGILDVFVESAVVQVAREEFKSATGRTLRIPSS
jgi:hypothetical protein